MPVKNVICKIIGFIMLVMIFIFGGLKVAVCAQHNVEWVEIQDPKSGRITSAIFCHPLPGTKLPAVIYNHGKIIEKVGYKGGLSKGYDVAEFVKALADNQYVAIAPIRPAGTDFFFAPINRGVISYLKQRADVDFNHIGIIGFSKGGYMALEAATKMPELKAVVAMSPARPQAPLGKDELSKIQAPIFVTLGKEELSDEIGQATLRYVVNILRQLQKNVEFKSGYNGGHKWFYRVRPEYWPDIIGFLNKYLNPPSSSY